MRGFGILNTNFWAKENRYGLLYHHAKKRHTVRSTCRAGIYPRQDQAFKKRTIERAFLSFDFRRRAFFGVLQHD